VFTKWLPFSASDDAIFGCHLVTRDPCLSPRPCVFTTTHPNPDSLFQGPHCGRSHPSQSFNKGSPFASPSWLQRPFRDSAENGLMAHCIRAEAVGPSWRPLFYCGLFLCLSLNFPVILPSSYLPFILSFWVPVFTSFFFHIPVSNYCMNRKKLAHCFILAL